jgi:hypothetical protein
VQRTRRHREGCKTSIRQHVKFDQTSSPREGGDKCWNNTSHVLSSTRTNQKQDTHEGRVAEHAQVKFKVHKLQNVEFYRTHSTHYDLAHEAQITPPVPRRPGFTSLRGRQVFVVSIAHASSVAGSASAASMRAVGLSHTGVKLFQQVLKQKQESQPNHTSDSKKQHTHHITS